MRMEPISILLVEDDAALGAATQAMLERHLYQVSWAREVRTAVAHLRGARAASWDLMLLDLDLNGDAGESVLQLGRRENADIPPIIVVSAQPLDESQRRAAAMGALQVMRKPVGAEHLIQAVRRVVRTY